MDAEAMLITMLKGWTRPAEDRLPMKRSAPRTRVVDISGPLPRHEPEPRPVTPMGSLPREMDPFEADFPWIGWVEPKHESVVASERRSPTFESDLERVLRIFAN
jgi:hypothetical protein